MLLARRGFRSAVLPVTIRCAGCRYGMTGFKTLLICVGEAIDTSVGMVSTSRDSIMSNSARCFVVLAFLWGGGILAEPVQVAPANPHYYSYQGKPILLITWI